MGPRLALAPTRDLEREAGALGLRIYTHHPTPYVTQLLTTMNRFVLSFLTLLLALPALAQDEPSQPIVVASYHQCDWNGLGDLVTQDRERTLPIFQDMVDEGMIYSAGTGVHDYGDEWNMVTWHVADDMEAAMAATEEVARRYNEAYPGDGLFLETCPKHRDVIYGAASWTTGGETPVVDEENTHSMAISFYTCPFSALGKIKETYDRIQLPVAQALVDEGKLYDEGLYAHIYGDEWNVVLTRSAESFPAMLAASDEMDARIADVVTEDDQGFFQLGCTAHKDNIYTVVMATTPRASDEDNE